MALELNMQTLTITLKFGTQELEVMMKLGTYQLWPGDKPIAGNLNVLQLVQIHVRVHPYVQLKRVCY
jgi:hypothetical protein